MICYVDDLLHLGFNPIEDMDALDMIYRLKEGFGSPDQYLGENADKVQFNYVQVVWSTNSVDYLKSAIEMLIIHLEYIIRLSTCSQG